MGSLRSVRTAAVAAGLAFVGLVSALPAACSPTTQEGPEAGPVLPVDSAACGDASCGAGCGHLCAVGMACKADTDCETMICTTGMCAAPGNCTDGMRNGRETDKDCGGDCPTKCAHGQTCGVAGDCTTGHCGIAGICDDASCGDGVKSGDETDVDCGGSCMNACMPGQGCAKPGDCTSRVCAGNMCAAPSCTDKVQNGQESDIDCGGACAPCANGNRCAAPTDCMSGICTGVCHACETGLDCGSRVCRNQQCVTPTSTPAPSCVGLANCPGGDSCCTTLPVPGGTFFRSYDGTTFPSMQTSQSATVGNFALDKYEVTVGRFRKFVEAYPGSIPVAGDGANANNPMDPGWNPANITLPTSQAALIAAVTSPACMGGNANYTMTPGANENLPMNCLDWPTANAFCTWDNARLPTEAEWNYAAAGGAEQRKFPWGSQDPSGRAAISDGQTNGNFVAVGSLGAAGASKYNQLDMAGNVWEWVLDIFVDPYPGACANCAVLALPADAGMVQAQRVLRGGSVNVGDYPLIDAGGGPPIFPPSAYRGRVDGTNIYFDQGVRCARFSP